MKIFCSVRLLACLSLCFPILFVEAASVQEACFETLKENMAEIGAFEKVASDLSNKAYGEVKFSPYYKNMSSFGVTLDEPLFDVRIYDWGVKTGYVHPPQSPFPSSTKSDTWKRPARQNIYAEEYIRNEAGKRQFLGCAYFQILGPDLKAITRDRYLYDGELMSALKVAPDYKAWYNENFSFGLEGEHFVTWKRLFVYPKSTQNDYFDKYSVAAGIPANSIESFAVLNPSKGTEDGDAVEFVSYNPNGKINVMSNEALQPVRWPENEVFPMNTYYQAIEAQFPKMSERLSIHGAVSYETYKDLISHRDETKKNYVWSVAHDTRDVTRYYIQRKKGVVKKDEVFEEFLETIPKLEQVVASAVAPHKKEDKEVVENVGKEVEKVDEVTSVEEIVEVEEVGSQMDKNDQKQNLILALLGLIFLLILLFPMFKRKQ